MLGGTYNYHIGFPCYVPSLSSVRISVPAQPNIPSYCWVVFHLFISHALRLGGSSGQIFAESSRNDHAYGLMPHSLLRLQASQNHLLQQHIYSHSEYSPNTEQPRNAVNLLQDPCLDSLSNVVFAARHIRIC
jgi:hypothetical protein